MYVRILSALSVILSLLVSTGVLAADHHAGRKLKQADYLLYRTINETVHKTVAAEKRRQQKKYDVTDEIKIAISRGHHAFWFPFETRHDLGPILNAFGRIFTVGVEIGPQDCSFSAELLANWTHATKYYLLGSWITSGDKEDPLSLSQATHDSHLQACKDLKNKNAVVVRVQDEIPKRSSVPESEVDFVFVNDMVRHDYCSMASILREWWPKIKLGGVIGGKHYAHAHEVKSRNDGEMWDVSKNHSGLPSKCKDGSDHPGGIAGAINEFVMAHGLQLQIGYHLPEVQSPYKFWTLRKSKPLCELEVTQVGSSLSGSSQGEASGPSSASHEGSSLGRFLIPPTSRDDLGVMMEAMTGFKVGVELGVQRGLNSKLILQGWKSNERYYLVDLWAAQRNYEDLANVDNSEQDKIYEFAQEELKPWKNKTRFIRNYTSLAYYQVNEPIDFVYVDARHDFCGCREDIRMWWSKLRPGGIMAGHDYVSDMGGQDWSKCMDGSVHNGAVKGAVLEFAMEKGLHVTVAWVEPHSWRTWVIRKPPAC